MLAASGRNVSIKLFVSIKVKGQKMIHQNKYEKNDEKQGHQK